MVNEYMSKTSLDQILENNILCKFATQKIDLPAGSAYVKLPTQ